MPVDYKNGKIYKIESLEGNCVYYGSTTQKLCVRMAGHRANYKYNNNGTTSEQVLCFNDAKIYLIENYPCNTKEELCAREGYYIKNFECVNSQIAGRDQKGWYDDNKKRILNERKQYYEKHKENIKTYKKKYSEKNRQLIREKKRQKEICQCGVIINKNVRAKHLKTKKHKAILLNPFINFKL